MLTPLRTTVFDPQFLNLVVQLDQELWHRYGAEQEKFQRHNVLDEHARVVLVTVHDVPMACGSFRPAKQPGVVEMKRMYTAEEMRGRGLGSLVLAELEKWALETGNEKAILETGIHQPDAVALYSKAGYTVTENYEPYQECSYSICMEKILK